MFCDSQTQCILSMYRYVCLMFQHWHRPVKLHRATPLVNSSTLKHEGYMISQPAVVGKKMHSVCALHPAG